MSEFGEVLNEIEEVGQMAAAPCYILKPVVALVACQFNDPIQEPVASSTLVNIHHLPSLLLLPISYKTISALLGFFTHACILS